nr:hypothetical protein [Chloroflexia bacterium]
MGNEDCDNPPGQSRMPFTRRTAIRGVGAGVAAALTTQIGSRDRRGSKAQSIATSPANQPQTVDYLLVAEEIDWELMPGVPV